MMKKRHRHHQTLLRLQQQQRQRHLLRLQPPTHHCFLSVGMVKSLQTKTIRHPKKTLLQLQQLLRLRLRLLPSGRVDCDCLRGTCYCWVRHPPHHHHYYHQQVVPSSRCCRCFGYDEANMACSCSQPGLVKMVSELVAALFGWSRARRRTTKRYFQQLLRKLER